MRLGGAHTGVHCIIFLYMLVISLDKVKEKEKEPWGKNVPFKLTNSRVKYVLYQNNGKYSMARDDPR